MTVINRSAFGSLFLRFWNIRFFSNKVFYHKRLIYMTIIHNNSGGTSKNQEIQRRATYMLYELRGCKYQERLMRLGSTELDNRRKRGFKFINEFLKGFNVCKK